ncbi:hypothetical protein PROFUN_13327 [Planoprotostelium fungivorum]|uniref:Uncharacterized protein n=1 Tax=Planoprotostelium fungivorum TaxID=1890364 RepID=A0A2P6N463_9EUKA|nr:hypothetical protein PROFUN_13327 [Planoprotostelium fungivorum]
MDYVLVKTFPVKRTEPKAFDELPVTVLTEQVRQQTGKAATEQTLRSMNSLLLCFCHEILMSDLILLQFPETLATSNSTY